MPIVLTTTALWKCIDINSVETVYIYAIILASIKKKSLCANLPITEKFTMFNVALLFRVY